jgi:hypothetical protein
MPWESLRSKRLVHKIFFLYLPISNRLARNLISQKVTMKAGTYQLSGTHCDCRRSLGVSAMPRNRVRKMVRLMFIDHTHQHLFQPLLYQVATGSQELILPNDA